MRPAEIDLVEQTNTNTNDIETNKKNIVQETNRATEAENTLTQNLTNEITRAQNAEKANSDAIVKETEDRTNADAEINAKFPVTTDNIADGAVTTAKLEQDVQDKLTLVESFPTLTYGESEATTVSANSNVLVDITFPSPLTEAPNVYCMARSTVCIECNVEQVTNAQVSIRLYNNTTSDAESVSIDWLAISGR